MGFFTYTDNIPFATNNPSNDQPNMQTNTNSIDSLINIDHYSFNNNLGGIHKKTQLYNDPNAPAVPSGLIANEGTLYTNTSANGSQLFYTPDASGNAYQLTTVNATNFTTFSKNNAYGTPPAGKTQNGGWTFLPGGMLLQYGFFGTLNSATTNIQFPLAFTNAPYSITFTVYDSSANSNSVYIISSSIPPTTTGFNIKGAGGGGQLGLYWMAIGV